ncbi:hypothetical protein MO973_31030 [Paenibacillus sp. TRM 82003]|nr:hypothetical protein [Paenibacillus sp. TRM 82003]
MRNGKFGGRFRLSAAEAPNFGYDVGVAWAQMEIRNDTAREEWLLTVEYPPLDEVELYIVDERGSADVIAAPGRRGLTRLRGKGGIA